MDFEKWIPEVGKVYVHNINSESRAKAENFAKELVKHYKTKMNKTIRADVLSLHTYRNYVIATLLPDKV